MIVLTSLILFLSLFVGLIILQVFLSKRESKWPGLILPILSFSISLLTILSMVTFMGVRTELHHIETDAVLVQRNYIEEYPSQEPSEEEQAQIEARIAEMEAMREEFAAQHSTITQEQTGAVIARILFTFIYTNIPTIILITIYFACRGKQSRKRALDMMSLQDM